VSKSPPVVGLCYRCEHRAVARETRGAIRPRYQCGVEYGASDCYQFSPVRPPVLIPSESERRLWKGKRPRFAGTMIAGREESHGAANCRILLLRVGKEGRVPFCVPEEIAGAVVRILRDLGGLPWWEDVQMSVDLKKMADDWRFRNEPASALARQVAEAVLDELIERSFNTSGQTGRLAEQLRREICGKEKAK
jgi:hypothetical protein